MDERIGVRGAPCPPSSLIPNDDLSTPNRVHVAALNSSLALLLLLQPEAKHLDSRACACACAHALFLSPSPSPSLSLSPSPSPSPCPYPVQAEAHPPPPDPAWTAPETPSSCWCTRRDGRPRWRIAPSGPEPRRRGSASWRPGLAVARSEGPSRPRGPVWRDCVSWGGGRRPGRCWQRGLRAVVVAVAVGGLVRAERIGRWAGRM